MSDLLERARRGLETVDGKLRTVGSFKSRPDDVRAVIATAFRGGRVRVTVSYGETVLAGELIDVGMLYQHSMPSAVVLKRDSGSTMIISTANILTIQEA